MLPNVKFTLKAVVTQEVGCATLELCALELPENEKAQFQSLVTSMMSLTPCARTITTDFKCDATDRFMALPNELNCVPTSVFATFLEQNQGREVMFRISTETAEI